MDLRLKCIRNKVFDWLNVVVRVDQNFEKRHRNGRDRRFDFPNIMMEGEQDWDFNAPQYIDFSRPQIFSDDENIEDYFGR